MGFRDMELADRMQGRMFVVSFVAGSAAAWLPWGFAVVVLAGFSGEAAVVA
jgi:F0F1-type ATP synthase assembly protein I